MDIFTGLIGIAVFVASLLIAVVWLVFPFIVMSKLKRLEWYLRETEKHTKAQAEFWNNRNVKIDE